MTGFSLEDTIINLIKGGNSDIGVFLLSLQHTETVDFSFNPLADPRFMFHDHALVEAVKLENPEVHAFFRLLALCHTVMAEEKKEGQCF